MVFPLIDGLLQRFHLRAGLHRLHDFFHGNIKLPRYLRQRRIAPVLPLQPLPHRIRFPRQFPDRAAHLHHPLRPQKPPDLPRNHRNRIRRKTDFKRRIKFINRLQQPNAPDLAQILHLHPAVCKPPHHAPDQSHIFLCQCIPCRFIPFVCLFDQGKRMFHAF